MEEQQQTMLYIPSPQYFDSRVKTIIPEAIEAAALAPPNFLCIILQVEKIISMK